MPGYKDLMIFLGTMCETEGDDYFDPRPHSINSRRWKLEEALSKSKNKEVNLFTDIFPEGLPAGAKDSIICGGGVGGFTPRSTFDLRENLGRVIAPWTYVILFWWSILFLIGLPAVSYIYGGMTPASSIWFMIRQWMN